MTGPHGVERDVDRIAEPGEDRRDRGGAEQPAGRRPARQLTVAVAATVLVAVVLTVGLTLGLSRLWAAETDVPVAPAALLVAGVVGVLAGGLLAVLLARRSVAPLLAVIGRQQRFVADTRQELQTPLTVVYLRAQLIARRTPPDDPALPAIRQLLADSRVLGEIADDLAAGARLGPEPGAAESVDVRELLQEVAMSMSVLADEQDATVVVTIPVQARVNGSRAALRRALIALVNRALANAARGGFIDLAAVVTDEVVVLSVTDDGQGLDGEPAPPPAGRAERPTTGLDLVRAVAVAHGGALRLGPGPAGGIRAEIELPAPR
jgi:signal transduction histidine kinase